MDKSVRTRLAKEDEREERELQSFTAQSLASQMMNSFPGAVNPAQTEAAKNITERAQETAVNQQTEPH